MSNKLRHAQQTVSRRRMSAMVGTTAAIASLLTLQPATASAQQAASSGFDIDSAVENLNQQSRENAWNTRNNLIAQAEASLPADQAAAAAETIDGTVNALFPGLIQEREAAIAAAKAEAARQAAAQAEADRQAAAAQAAASFDRGSCPTWADACVDLNGGRSWLQSNGEVTYVAPSSAGAPSPETATPTGTFTVQYKVKDEVSRQFNNAPMPNSVYFTNQGHAFHSGAVGVLSHGCVHLNYADSEVFFNTLQPGDTVFIY